MVHCCKYFKYVILYFIVANILNTLLLVHCCKYFKYVILWFIVANILNALFHISLCHVYLSNILIEGFYEDPLEDNVEGLKYSD